VLRSPVPRRGEKPLACERFETGRMPLWYTRAQTGRLPSDNRFRHESVRPPRCLLVGFVGAKSPRIVDGGSQFSDEEVHENSNTLEATVVAHANPRCQHRGPLLYPLKPPTNRVNDRAEVARHLQRRREGVVTKVIVAEHDLCSVLHGEFLKAECAVPVLCCE